MKFFCFSSYESREREEGDERMNFQYYSFKILKNITNNVNERFLLTHYPYEIRKLKYTKHIRYKLNMVNL